MSTGNENETATQPASERRPITLDELRERQLLLATAPSGAVYRVRPLNLERHALAGGFPTALREVAIKQTLGVPVVREQDEGEELVGRAGRLSSYFDELVRTLIVDPNLRDSQPGEPDPLSLLPAVDYDWAVGIALGTISTDGDGRRLWGEPLTRFPEPAP